VLHRPSIEQADIVPISKSAIPQLDSNRPFMLCQGMKRSQPEEKSLPDLIFHVRKSLS